jgi:tRNA threonylcarbamoyladenosine biosynthesis protein TsaE
MKHLSWLWLPVIAWCALIFWWSSIPHLAIASGAADFWTRKPAHVFEYAILTILLYRAMMQGAVSTWRGEVALTAIVLSLLYAASDEIHQHFVIGRTGKVSDLGFDLLGGLVGASCAFWWSWWQRVTSTPAPSPGERMTSHQVASVEELQAFARQVAQELRGGEVLALSGDLGAGKTTFTQGLAQALGVKETVSSPTFVLTREYQTDRDFNLHHFDWYRLDQPEMISNLGVEEVLGRPDVVAVIEWPERARHLLPLSTHWIEIAVTDQNQRFITYRRILTESG